MAAVRETLHFIGQFATRFRQTGAVMPSGGPLARAMVEAVGPLVPGTVVVELGPGTGVFTRELVRRFPANPLVVVEFNQVFAARLRSGMPAVRVVEGCASKLVDHLAALGIVPAQVGAVVSGLPLLSLPRELAVDIVAAIAAALPIDRRYVQFTYSQRAWRRFELPNLRLERSRRVWLNVPPAAVMTFGRTA
jgi:phosphatidylethanolamine/phosphatidyl-N-methylethanolamine N-methyltransferase